MRTVILEPLNYPDEARAILERVGTVADGLPGADTGALVVRLNWHIDSHFLDLAPGLRYVLSATTGLDHIDLDECKTRAIEVISLQGETAFLRTIPATAELTWGLLLALTRHIPAAADHARMGGWERDLFRGHDLKGKTLGILGMGRVGRMVYKYAEAFGMETQFYDPPVYGHDRYDLDCLLEMSDIITIHVPLNQETRAMIGKAELAAMKPGALLVNTSRGDVIDEDALLAALERGQLGGAALDVVVGERGERSLRLQSYARRHDNLILTPHIGGCTVESMAAAETFIARKFWEKVK